MLEWLGFKNENLPRRALSQNLDHANVPAQLDGHRYSLVGILQQGSDTVKATPSVDYSVAVPLAQKW